MIVELKASEVKQAIREWLERRDIFIPDESKSIEIVDIRYPNYTIDGSLRVRAVVDDTKSFKKGPYR